VRLQESLVLYSNESQSKRRLASNDLPQPITFHSLVGRLNDEDPLSDPFASFLYLSKGSSNGTSEDGPDGPAFEPVEVSFRSFPASGIVTPEERTHLEKFSLIWRFTQNLPSLDIIVYSCGHWGPAADRLTISGCCLVSGVPVSAASISQRSTDRDGTTSF
jgi:hypothetical protein